MENQDKILNGFFKSVDNILIKGYLIPSEDPKEIWFPYSIETNKILKPGIILAVKNFDSINIDKLTQKDLHFSLLEVVDVKVQHYKIADLAENPQSIKLSETFEKFLDDWYRSLDDEEKEDLKIVVYAVPHYQELYVPSAETKAVYNLDYDYGFKPSNAEPIVGEHVYILKNEHIETYINGKIKESKTSFKAGKHQILKDVNVHMDYYPLFNRHFGVFGFTGAGKSNLLSTLISKSLLEAPSSVNFLIFDINNEYFGLLFDALAQRDSYIVFLEEKAISGNYLRQFLRGDFGENFEEILQKAAMDFIAGTNFPDEIKNKKNFEKLYLLVMYMLQAGKIRVFQQSITMMEFLAEVISETEEKLNKGTFRRIFSGRGSKEKREAFNDFLALTLHIWGDNINLSKINFMQVVAYLNLINKYVKTKDKNIELSKELIEILEQILEVIGEDDFIKALGVFFETLQKKYKRYEMILRFHFSINLNELINITHDDEGSIVIFLSESDNNMRNFANILGNVLYSIRKNKKIENEPLTLFLFEEADLFIPQKVEGEKEDKESIQKSKEIATTLARRGRKYKLGLGIATQRTAYLDTSIIAQLGTYFVSKLPRSYDRKVVADGFGIDEKQMSLTSKFLPGDWMVLTHVGTLNIKTSPVMISFENANERLINFLENIDLNSVLENQMKKVDLKAIFTNKENVFSEITKEEIFEIFPILV